MNRAQKIMRQKYFIKDELDERLPKWQSGAIWKAASARLEVLLEKYRELPEGVRSHTDHYIFPSAAVYLTVKEAVGQETAYTILEEAAAKASYKAAETLGKIMKIPGMKNLFIKAWEPMTKKKFGSDSGFQNVFYPKQKGSFRADITACPYNRYFTELGCPELTKIFCANDDRVYGNLPGIRFARTGTLGRGNDKCDFCAELSDRVRVDDLPYGEKIRQWLSERYGEETEGIWRKTKENYTAFLEESPDLGGRKNGHAFAIYGGLLVFALYKALPDQPPVSQLQEFVQNLFMEPFTKLGKVFDLNRPFDMKLIDMVFRRSGNRDRKDILKYPDGFINVDAPYDSEHQAAGYSFTQCPNAEFAKKHDMLNVLPLLCNCDFYGISEIHGTLIREGTCGNSDVCDYRVVGNRNPLAKEYKIVTDEKGFLVSRKKDRADVV